MFAQANALHGVGALTEGAVSVRPTADFSPDIPEPRLTWPRGACCIGPARPHKLCAGGVDGASRTAPAPAPAPAPAAAAAAEPAPC